MKDFILDSGDLKIRNGDFVIGESDAQNQSLILQLPKGAIKENPDATVGVMNYLESENVAAMLRDIRGRFEDDGMEVKRLEFDANGKLIVDAPYK